MLLGYWRNDECGVHVHQRCPQRAELRVTSSDFQVLHDVNKLQAPSQRLACTYSSPDRVDNKASTAFVILAGICDDNLQVRVFVENLFDPAVIASLLPRYLLVSRMARIVFIVIVITQALRPRDEFGALVWRR